MTTPSAQSNTHNACHVSSNNNDELILVVKRSHLFSDSTWHGLNINALPHCLETISKYGEFHPRSQMETDPNYKQIIPYLIFEHEKSFFLMQRKYDSSEQRLQNKHTLGIGGHMNFSDLQNGADLFSWARREFEEEVSYQGTFDVVPLGVLNDDSNDVGQVHIGLVLMLMGNSADIKIKSELKSGVLTPLVDCLDYVPTMETWSQIVLMKLLKEGLSFTPQ